MNDETHIAEPSRRDLLTLIWQCVGVIALGISGLIGLRFLSSRSQPSDFGTTIAVGHVEDFPPGTVTAFDNARLYLVRREDGGFLALHRRCTHLDCTILWDAQSDQFHCPCHGSLFTREGDILNPPALRLLVRFPIVIDEKGQLQVETGTLIERTRVSSTDFTYP